MAGAGVITQLGRRSRRGPEEVACSAQVTQPGRGCNRTRPGSSLPWCCSHTVPASHREPPMWDAGYKEHSRPLQIWNGSPSSPLECQAVLLLSRSTVPSLLPYPRPPKQIPKQSNPCVASPSLVLCKVSTGCTSTTKG